MEDGFRGKGSVWRMGLEEREVEDGLEERELSGGWFRGKRIVQRSRFPLKRKGRSFHVEGPTTEKAREPTEESLVGVMPVGTKSIRSRAESSE